MIKIHDLGRLYDSMFIIELFHLHLSHAKSHNALLICIFNSSLNTLSCAEPRLRWTISRIEPQRTRPASKQVVLTSCQLWPTGDNPPSPPDTNLCCQTQLISVQETREKNIFKSLCVRFEVVQFLSCVPAYTSDIGFILRFHHFCFQLYRTHVVTADENLTFPDFAAS